MGIETVLVLAGVFVIFRLVRPLTIVNQLLRQRFWKPRAWLITEDDVPAYVRDSFREPMTELQSLGFEIVQWFALGDERGERNPPRFSACLFHANARAYADVAFALLPNSTIPWTVTFSTFGADRVVRTYPGERPFFGDAADTIAVEPFAPTIALQWDAHRAAVQDAGITPADVDHDTIFARGTARRAEWFASLVERRVFVAAEGSAYVLSWRAALSRYRSLKTGQRRVAAQMAARASTLKPIASVPLEEEVAAYERSVQQISSPPRPSFLALLFAVSVALFIAGGSYVFGTARTAIIVVGVVLFHELGHYLAMRAFGYVDTTIFFVPFLGGISTGRKDDATVSQRMIVLLAGPVPGLLLAIAIALVGRGECPRDVLFILAGVNFFNLLPVLPLDGGQVAHMLLFARHPVLDVVFRAVAGVALVLISVVASAGIFFAVLGVITLVQLPKSLRQSRLRQHFREMRVRLPDTAPAELFFRMMRASPQATAPFAQKVVLARQTLASAEADARVKRSALFGWLASYAGFFAIAFVAMALTFGSASDPRSAARKSVEPVAAAALTCPMITNYSPTPPESSIPSRMTLAAVAAFATPEAMNAARPAISSALPNAISRDLGSVLLFWSIAFDADDDENDSEAGDVNERHARRMTPIANTVNAAGGRFYDLGWLPYLAVDCVAPNEAAAQAIEDTFEDYALALRDDMSFVPPWTSTTEPTAAQALARRTFRIAMRAADDRTHEEPVRLSTFLGLFGGGTKAVKAHVQKRQEQRALHAAAALAAERAKRPIDEEVARLVTRKIATISIDERERVTAELQARLGVIDEPGRPRSFALAFRSWHDGAHLRLLIDHATPKQFDSTVRPMLSWLCTQSCVDPHLLVDNPANAFGPGKR